MDDRNGQTTYGYDILGRIGSVTDSSGHTVEYSYDEYGRLSSIQYPEDRTVFYAYDLGDRLIRVTDSEGETTEYTYDPNGNVLTCERSSGLRTEYAYDEAGRLVSLVNMQSDETVSSFTYTYDGNGQIATEEAIQGETISEKTFTYDAEGQLLQYSENLDGEVSVTTYGYSDSGSRTAVTKGADAVVYEYNDLGQLIRETDYAKGTTEYTYDENGNLTGKDNGDTTLTYTYNIENRLTAVHEGGSLLMAASYDGDGNRIFQITRQETPFSVEDRNTENNPDLPLSGQSEDRTEAGVVPEPDPAQANCDQGQGIPEASSAEKETARTYYEQIYADPADTIFWYGFGQGLLQLFANVNRALGAYLSDWFCQAWELVTGQYELVVHSDIQYSPEDIETMQNAGLTEQEIAQITGLPFDEAGHIILADTESGEPADEKADPNAIMYAEDIESSGNSVIIPADPDQATRIDYDLTYYVNDINTSNEQVLMTYGRNESEKAFYTYGLERIAENSLRTGEQSDYLYDGRGSVVQTASDGGIDLSITYSPFGEITSGVDENFVGFAYNGEENNEVTGLQYLRARYYDSGLGSFLTIDSYLGSLTDIPGQNRYTYAENDPVNRIDPSGHSSINVSGISQYTGSGALNEMRDYMTSAALWAGQVNAQNSFNRSVVKAGSTSFMSYASISGISQSAANSYINQGIAAAQQVSGNYGCDTGAVSNAAVARFTGNVNAAKADANSQIAAIKAAKKAQYDEYQAYLEYLTYLAKQEEQAKILERQDAAACTLQNISATLKKLGMSGLVKSVGMTQKSSWVDSAWKKGKNFAGGLAASSIRNVVLEPALNMYMLAEALLTGYTTSSSQMRTTLDLYESSLYYKYVSDPEAYYIGRMAGDAVGLVVGAAEAALGVTSLMTAVTIDTGEQWFPGQVSVPL